MCVFIHTCIHERVCVYVCVCARARVISKLFFTSGMGFKKKKKIKKGTWDSADIWWFSANLDLAKKIVNSGEKN